MLNSILSLSWSKLILKMLRLLARYSQPTAISPLAAEWAYFRRRERPKKCLLAKINIFSYFSSRWLERLACVLRWFVVMLGNLRSVQILFKYQIVCALDGKNLDANLVGLGVLCRKFSNFFFRKIIKIFVETI